LQRLDETLFNALSHQMIAVAAEAGNWRVSRVVEENLSYVAARDFEQASIGIPHCIGRISALVAASAGTTFTGCQ
jgi:hypothetical protein